MDAGVKFGRKMHDKSGIALELISQNQTAKVVMEKTGTSRATYFRLKKITISMSVKTNVLII